MGAQDNAVFKLGGISALAIAGLYLVIMGLYGAVGLVPTGARQWLEYLGPHANIWWAIVVLSAVTDLLFLPVALALYRRLRGDHDMLLMVGTGLLAVFAIIDLAVTQMNFAVLIGLSVQYGSAWAAQQADLLAAAMYASAAVDSFMLSVYVILVPGLGVLAVSAVMRNAGLGRITSWIGIASGLAGVAAVIGPLFVPALGQLTYVAAMLMTVWVVPVGRMLWRKGSRASVATTTLRMEAAVPAQA